MKGFLSCAVRFRRDGRELDFSSVSGYLLVVNERVKEMTQPSFLE